MKRNSNKIKESISPKRIGIFIVSVMSLFLIVFIFSFNHLKTTNGGFGDLLSGTIGVGASICAMFLIILTLWEQRKMNKQIEVHHLVESFNSRFDTFIRLQKEPSEFDSNKTCKEHLKELWPDENSDGDSNIPSTLNKVTKLLRDKTYDELLKLRGFCNDEDLTRVSRSLNRLLSIKEKIEELDPEAVNRINDDWESITHVWKKYAGFYFGWKSSEYKISIAEVLRNEMTKYFSDLTDAKLPEFIPQIRIYNEEKEMQLLLEDFSKLCVFIESKCAFDASIHEIKISGYGKQNPIILPINITLAPSYKNYCTLLELFGMGLSEAYLHISKAPIHENRSIFNIDFKISYIKKYWTYECLLELNRYYDNGYATLIFNQIEEKQ